MRRRYTAREEVAFPVQVSASDFEITVTEGVATVILEKDD